LRDERCTDRGTDKSRSGIGTEAPVVAVPVAPAYTKI